jgi:3-oxoacyl-[acyl-carrier protein] reductase
VNLGLDGRAALVLAAGAGLGRAAALEFAREGANVMLFSLDEEHCRSAQEEISSKTGVKPAYTVGNLLEADDIEHAVSRTVDEFGSIDVLVNNTGGPPAGPFEKFSDADWQKAFELTLLSYIRSTRAAIPHMRRGGGGRIVNYASSSVRRAIDNLILSNTFRAGVMSLSKTLARELAPDDILVNTLGPGRIDTDRVRQLDQLRAEREGVPAEEVRQRSIAAIPIGRYGTPEEYAGLTVFLGSWANTYITGQTILVDGGMVKAY